jgi:flagellar biosynthesis GTPase FlhF
MSKKIAPRVMLNFEPEHISDEEELIEDEELDLAKPANGLPCEVPEVIERKKIVENDIFDNINPSLNGMSEDIVINEVDESPPPAPRKKPQKQTDITKPKRKLSEEHAAKLALAREKALATRRAKAEEKKKMKKIEDETKELKKKKAQKDLEILKDEVVNNKPVTVQQNSTVMFSKKDLEDAQLEAIMKYEAIRLARKEEKKKQKLIDEQKEQLKRKIQGYGARDANGRLLNKWDRCY